MRLGEIRRILVLNRNRIGDCLLTTPMLRALKRRFPAAHVAVAVPASNQELLVSNPHVNEIVRRPRESNWAAKFAFAFEMRRRGYDLIISLQEKSLFYAWATCYAQLLRGRSTLTIGLDHSRTRRYYQQLSPIRAEEHEVYKYLRIAEMLGCPPEPNPVLELEPPAESRERAQRFLANQGVDSEARFVGINPGGTELQKRWPVERFAEVGDRLHQELNLPVMIFGGPGDSEMAAAIVRQMSHRPLIAAGRASLGETAALMERCQLLVTGDTGPMHMAVALAVPVVALFGPTSPEKFGPFTTLRTVLRHAAPCAECEQRLDARRRPPAPGREFPRDRPPCLHTITAEESIEAALRLYSVPLSMPPSSRPGMDQRSGLDRR